MANCFVYSEKHKCARNNDYVKPMNKQHVKHDRDHGDIRQPPFTNKVINIQSFLSQKKARQNYSL